jgi:hypothetical protein
VNDQDSGSSAASSGAGGSGASTSTASGSSGSGGSGSGEDCGQAILATIGTSEPGTTIGALNDYGGPPQCSGCASSVEVVYRLDVPAMTNLQIRYLSLTGSGEDDCLFLHFDCGNGNVGEVVCGDPTTELTVSRVFGQAATAYLFVDTETPRDFSLTFEAL